MKSEAGDRAVRNLLGRVDRKHGEEKAQAVRVELPTLRNERVSKGVRLGVAVVQHEAVL